MSDFEDGKKLSNQKKLRTLYLWSLVLQQSPLLHSSGCLDSAKPFKRTPSNLYQKPPAGHISRENQNMQQQVQFSILHFCCTANSSATLFYAKKGGDGHQAQQEPRYCVFSLKYRMPLSSGKLCCAGAKSLGEIFPACVRASASFLFDLNERFLPKVREKSCSQRLMVLAR